MRRARPGQFYPPKAQVLYHGASQVGSSPIPATAALYYFVISCCLTPEGSCSNSVLLYLHTQNAQDTHWGGSKEEKQPEKMTQDNQMGIWGPNILKIIQRKNAGLLYGLGLEEAGF